MSNEHEHRSHQHKKHRHYDRKQLIRRDIIRNVVFSVVIIGAAFALVFLMDYLDLNRDDPVEVTPPTNVVEQQTTTTTVPEEEVALAPALPEETYAYVGQPITFYYLNLTGYNSLEDLEVEVDAGGKGTIYKDRWEYTPRKAEKVTFRFTARNKKNVVSEGTCVIHVKERSKKDELTMLVIGDSTIEAGQETEQLLKLAGADNCDLTLLGTLIPPYLYNADNKMEGRGGWRAEHYASVKGFDGHINPFYNPTTKCFDFRYYMESQWYTDVDVVCIQLGINDVFGAKNDTELEKSFTSLYLQYMDTMIESIHEYDPDIKVVWNLILPGSADQKKFEYAYEMKQTAERYKRNTYLANLEIIKHVEGMDNVYVATTNAALNTKENMAASGHGAVHPATQGYKDIATQLYSLVRAIS